MIPKIKGNTTFNVLYFSDAHAKPINFRHLKTAFDTFHKEHPNDIILKLAGGDLNFASDLEPNILILKLLDLIGLDANCVGNHELEGGNYWAQAIDKAKSKLQILSANLNFSRQNPLQDKIAKSVVLERKGERAGIIGISPLDAEEFIFKSDFNDYLSVKNFEQTVKAIKEEVAILEEQGINKIFLLAHTGEKSKEGLAYYENLAKIGGIDVIIGGHDHTLFNRWFTSERGEPVKVVAIEAANDANKERK